MQTYTTSESIHTTTIFFVMFQQFWRKKFVGPSSTDGLAHIIYIKKILIYPSYIYLGTDDFYVFPPCSRLYNTNRRAEQSPQLLSVQAGVKFKIRYIGWEKWDLHVWWNMLSHSLLLNLSFEPFYCFNMLCLKTFVLLNWFA